MPQGLAFGSNQPTSNFPVSSLKYAQPSASRRLGSPGANPGTGSVTM